MDLTIKDSFMTLLTVVLCIAGSVFFKVSMFFGFALANTALFAYYSYKGYRPRALIKAGWESLYSCRVVYIVIFLIGVSIAVWLASGVIPAIIYYGMAWFSPSTFLMSAFLICMVIAMIMGTALGTISTVGIALMGIGQGFGLAEPMVLGAIISGAYVSDKLSPISGLVNMNLGISDITYKDFFRRSMKTFIPVAIVTALGYLWLGQGAKTGGEAAANVLLDNLSSHFHMSPWLFLMPLLLIAMTVMGLKIHKSMGVCIALGIGFAIGMQGFSAAQMWQFILHGFYLDASYGQLADLLKGGGVLPMMEVILIVACAVAFAGMIEVTGALKPMIDSFVRQTDSQGMTQVKTGLLSILFLSIACDQSLAILLPAKSLKEDFKSKGMDRVELSRVVFDTGVMLAPLEFWNVNTIIILAMTGLGAGDYGPYAFMIWLMPMAAFLLGLYKHFTRRREQLNEEF